MRGGAAHRAPGAGHVRTHVIAAAAAVGAVATGTLTALLPGTPAPAESPAVDEVASPVLAASAGVLRDFGQMTAAIPAETIIPVAYGVD